MAKPTLLTVDDDAEVLAAIRRDLRTQYGAEYRVVAAGSAEEALKTLDEIKLRGEPVALLLSDQRMPGFNGVEFLERAKAIFPDAKRVLLTAYADTDAAIKAINDVKLDHYLLKPWDPPDEQLYPVVTDLLADWQAAYHPPFEGLRVIGHRWSPKSHALRDFLARNQVPYRWLDIETDPDAADLLQRAGTDPKTLPVALFADGSHAVDPSTTEVAERIGLQTEAKLPFYDLTIVGGGPAGLAAAVYGASEGLSTVMVEREAPGGQAGQSSRIENYLGFPVGLSGGDLARRAVAQARRFGVEILTPQVVTGVRVEDPYRYLTLESGAEIACHALIVATGVAYRKLDAPGVDRLSGAGVYYGAAMTEAISCRDEEVFVVGGANSAGQAAMYFARYASRVTMLVRGESLAKSMSQYLIDQIAETPTIRVRPFAEVARVDGEGKLASVTVRDVRTGAETTEAASSLFVFIGAAPRTDWLDGVVERDERGFLLTGADLIRGGKRPKGWTVDRDPALLETSVPGIFAAGDVRHGSVKRVASGVGEGAIAVSFVHQYLTKVGGTR